jgi:hypothetical protein
MVRVGLVLHAHALPPPSSPFGAVCPSAERPGFLPRRLPSCSSASTSLFLYTFGGTASAPWGPYKVWWQFLLLVVLLALDVLVAGQGLFSSIVAWGRQGCQVSRPLCTRGSSRLFLGVSGPGRHARQASTLPRRSGSPSWWASRCLSCSSTPMAVAFGGALSRLSRGFLAGSGLGELGLHTAASCWSCVSLYGLLDWALWGSPFALPSWSSAATVRIGYLVLGPPRGGSLLSSTLAT